MKNKINSFQNIDSILSFKKNNELVKKLEEILEKRYEEIIFEYQWGVDYLKYYHTQAYRDFHRIIGYKERYSRDVEFKNKKRLESFND